MRQALAIIPARGGSKRIPRKNLVPFAGKPLIAYPLTAAMESGLFDEIHVSTDDGEIAGVAESVGLLPKFMRPIDLAGEHTTILEVLRWVVLEYGRRGMTFATIALIYPTAPLIVAEDLRAAHKLFTASGACNPVMAVGEFPVPAQWAMTQGEDETLHVLDYAATQTRSQDLPRTYFDAGAFTFYSRRHIVEEAPEQLRYRPILLPRSRVVDIDTPDDLQFAAVLHRVLKETDTDAAME